MAWNEPGNGGKDKQNDPWGGSDTSGRDDKQGSNDPWQTDKRPSSGNGKAPPDIDQAIKALTQKVSGMFGKRNTGGSGGDEPPAVPRNALLLPGLIMGAVLVIWGASGFYMVDQSERAVVLRWGQYYDTLGPGVHWNPTFLDRVTRINTTQVRSLNQTAAMLTRDTNIVQVRISAQYQVSNPRDFLLNVRSPEQSIQNAMDSALRHVVGGTDMEEVLTRGRELMGSQVRQRLQSSLDQYNIGIKVLTVNIEGTSAPKEVQEAIDDVIRSREDRQRMVNEARAYENGILPQAQGQASRMLEEARGYRETVVADAQGQASRFISVLREYEKAPAVTRERLYLSTMSDVFAQSNKAIIDVTRGNPLINLPSQTPVPVRNAAAAGNNDQGSNPTDALASPYSTSNATSTHGRPDRNSTSGAESTRREGRQ